MVLNKRFGGLFIALLAAFSTEVYAAKVCVSLPTVNSRWSHDANILKTALEDAKHTVVIDYAANSANTQRGHINQYIKDKCDVVVITAVDSKGLGSVVKKAQRSSIPVIAYDRLILNTTGVSYYVTFRNSDVGRIQGQYIIDRLLVDKKHKVKNIEIFTGHIDDNNVNYFYAGAMYKLNPYLANGTIQVKSGQIEKNVVATENWSARAAEERMRELIRVHGYGPKGTRLDAVLTQNDTLAQGVIKALRGVGYTADNMPVITGQDSLVGSVKLMTKGYQSMTIFKDSRILASETVKMINSILNKETVFVNDKYSFYNGKMTVPTYVLTPVLVDLLNYKDVLFNSGFYNEKDFDKDDDLEDIKAKLEKDKKKAEKMNAKLEQAEKEAKEQEERELKAKAEAERAKLVKSVVQDDIPTIEMNDNTPVPEAENHGKGVVREEEHEEHEEKYEELPEIEHYDDEKELERVVNHDDEHHEALHDDISNLLDESSAPVEKKDPVLPPPALEHESLGDDISNLLDAPAPSSVASDDHKALEDDTSNLLDEKDTEKEKKETKLPAPNLEHDGLGDDISNLLNETEPVKKVNPALDDNKDVTLKELEELSGLGSK